MCVSRFDVSRSAPQTPPHSEDFSMDPRRSSEAFIKALKGKDTSASKIELAAEGWHSKTLYLPGKHSVIADWVIQSLCDGGSDSR